MKPIVKTTLQKNKYKNIFIMSFGEILVLNCNELKNNILERLGNSVKVDDKNFTYEYDFKFYNGFVFLCNDILECVSDNDEFYDDIKKQNGEKFALKLKEKNNTFLKQVHLRNETIIKILKHMVFIQNDFIGNNGIKNALTMEDISSHVGYSVSCVSRAIKNKKILINDTIINVKDLLCKKTKTGESKEHIMILIKDILNNEKNISSYKIELKLKNKGILISRRTVSNYINILKERGDVK